MPHKFVLICTLGLYLFAACQAMFAASTKRSCDLPQGLLEELSRKFPGAHVVTLTDLEEYQRKLFQKEHGTRCPGLIKVNFYGDGKPTWAVVLIKGESPNRKAELVVARRTGNIWETRSLESTDGTPVVWREGPGKYEDLYGKNTIRATRPVIVFCGLESWAIVFAWTGKEIEKVQISD